jgi:transcriptional regulator of heat shock response
MFVDKIAEIKPLSTAERRAIENFLDGAVDLDDVFNKEKEVEIDKLRDAYKKRK